jgi:hypothetical protein
MRQSDKVKFQFEKFRICLSSDNKCWIFEELQEGGIYKGTGEKGKSRWIELGYYGRLEHLVHAMLDREIEVPNGSLDTQLKSILEEIKKAEARLLEQMKVIE